MHVAASRVAQADSPASSRDGSDRYTGSFTSILKPSRNQLYSP